MVHAGLVVAAARRLGTAETPGEAAGKGPTMQKYICDACGWIYDPAKGDPAHGVPAGTAFQDVPDGWVCPECGADKSMFSPIKG